MLCRQVVQNVHTNQHFGLMIFFSKQGQSVTKTDEFLGLPTLLPIIKFKK